MAALPLDMEKKIVDGEGIDVVPFARLIARARIFADKFNSKAVCKNGEKLPRKLYQIDGGNGAVWAYQRGVPGRRFALLWFYGIDPSQVTVERGMGVTGGRTNYDIWLGDETTSDSEFFKILDDVIAEIDASYVEKNV